jgi:hypothetical protein
LIWLDKTALVSPALAQTELPKIPIL